MKQYRNLDYAANRLAGTIVSFLGEPVYVHHLDGQEFLVEFMGNRERKNVSAEHLDINPVPLGYVNTQEGAVYIGRKPVRKDWRQGFRENNSFSYGTNVGNLKFNELSCTIKGTYPPLLECVHTAGLSGASMAFHREWCMNPDGTLSYKTDPVGLWKDERLVLDENYVYLENKLMEALRENHLQNN